MSIIDIDRLNKRIRFSEDYNKLPRGVFGKKARLVFFSRIERDKQTQAFLDYDTKYRKRDGHYDLSGSKELILLVFNCEGTIFTSLRTFTWEKFTFYRGMEGEVFEVIRS